MDASLIGYAETTLVGFRKSSLLRFCYLGNASKKYMSEVSTKTRTPKKMKTSKSMSSLHCLLFFLHTCLCAFVQHDTNLYLSSFCLVIPQTCINPDTTKFESVTFFYILSSPSGFQPANTFSIIQNIVSAHQYIHSKPLCALLC